MGSRSQQSLKAAAAVAINRVVVYDSNGEVDEATSGDLAAGELYAGISLSTASARGDRIKVHSDLERCQGVAGGVLTPGTHRALQPTTGGKLIALTEGGAHVANWVSNGSDAKADGDIIDIEWLGHPDRHAYKTVTGTIATGTDTVSLAFGANWDGKDFAGVAVVQAAPDATATSFAAAWDGSGNLDVTSNANATADTDISVTVFN